MLDNTCIDSTFSRQKSLPQMPVPDLNVTCHKMLEWAAPLLTEQELTETQAVVEQFLQAGGDGEKLQNELIKLNQQDPHSNWAGPAWKNIYLDCSSPLPINSNVFYYLKNKLDESAYSQSHIAAALIVSAYQFMGLIDEQKLTVDMQKDTPLCMHQYKNIFSAIRIPKLGTDEFKVSESRQHIIVMHHGNIYKLNIMDSAGEVRSAAQIQFDLNCILSESASSADHGQNLGLLTTMPRDVWAEQRVKLLQLSKHNKTAMTAIEEAAFVLCLDQNAPEAITEVSKQLFHGDGNDRFFDKSLQFIVFANGKLGINFEHTGVDGSTMLRMIGHLYDNMDKVSIDPLSGQAVASAEKIEFDLDDELQHTLDDCSAAFKKHIANTQTRVLDFTQFGKDLIKTFAVSPDAFVQLALQLAEHKLYGKCYSAYEAVMTRTFVQGRIDVLYTVSEESMRFIQNMGDPNCNLQAKKDSLIKATQKHTARANECRSGNGVYSHFLALEHRYKLAGAELGIDTLPQIFKDTGYQNLVNSVVCTSTTSAYGVNLAGYAPIVEDGYGLRYFTLNDSIRFNMTSRTAMQDNLDKMKMYIEQTLLEMAELMRS